MCVCPIFTNPPDWLKTLLNSVKTHRPAAAPVGEMNWFPGEGGGKWLGITIYTPVTVKKTHKNCPVFKVFFLYISKSINCWVLHLSECFFFVGQISPITPDKEGSPEVEGNMSPLTPSTTPPLPPTTQPPLPQTPPLPTEDMEVGQSHFFRSEATSADNFVRLKPFHRRST